ncbi:protein ECT2 isoform X2 [Orussus abietinus]|uniref:protein ECT2 isoform X2 n=1 Tax=Orussus abietinus TaxID=222816 RepID=UPI0006261B20|nr:protein ECT2 isoform X2 [Orussus abietinus]
MEAQSVHSSTSDINSEDTAKSEPTIIPRKKRICLVGAAGEDPTLGAAAQEFNVPVLKSETGLEYTEDTSYCTYFILKKFEGLEYDALYKNSKVHRILGPTALLQLAERKESLPSITRPMYTQAMLGIIIVFTGFKEKRKEKSQLNKIINMVHYMGGSIRRDMESKVTHLIARYCRGEKYQYAVTFRVPVMSVDWISALWDARNDVSVHGNNEDLIAAFKLKPFFGAKVCFFGFPEEEKKHMCEVLQQQGGEPTEIDDPECTHVVTGYGDWRSKLPDKGNAMQLDLNLFLGSNRSPFHPLRPLRSKSFAFAYYDPYTNTIPNPSGPDLKDITTLPITKFSNFNRKRSNGSLSPYSTSVLPAYNEQTVHESSSVVVRNASNDSAIFMDYTSSDSQSLPEESGAVIDDFSTQSDSGIDFPSLTRVSKETTSIAFKSSRRLDFPISLMAVNVSSTRSSPETQTPGSKMEVDPETVTLSSDDLGSRNLGNNIPQIVDSPLPGAQQIEQPLYLGCLEKLKPEKLISSKKIHTPRKYIKWRRTKSCNTVPKVVVPDRSRFIKIYSHPNLTRRRDSQLSDSLLIESPVSGKKTRGFLNGFHFSGSVLSRLGEINLVPTFKQYMQVTPRRKVREESLPRQKYTPLSSPLPIPAKLARLANSECDARCPISPNTRTFDLLPSSVPVQTSLQTSETDRTKKRENKHLVVVVDESNVNCRPDLTSAGAYIVKAEWFWTSVQNEGAANEKEYLFDDYLESVLSPTASARRDSQPAGTPSSASTRRKRKRLTDTLSSLVQNGADSPAVHKRRSSISDAGHLSVNGSFLDCTASPDKQLLDDIPEVEAVSTESARKNLSPRHQVFLELVQTESNYVGILSTIMMLFKSPLEELIETSAELLNSTEAKIIFGNFPPIYEVHKKMLEELRYSAAHWTEDVSIGNIFLKYAPDLVKAYPPYVNFFENTKEMLDQCDQNKPRFHAFLKICQTKPECGRQSLKELLIKPVQRLPSISLLLNDILKHTNKNNPDHSALELSISSIKEVMTYINEDKRKTEGQLVMFDIFNEIDNCPPHLVSSHRSFIGKCEVAQVGEGLSGRGDPLVLFLFTDTLEICKKRSKFNSHKSPNTANGLHSVKMSQVKPYKHVRMLPLSNIKKVVDIRETDECPKVFALMVRSNQELKEKLFAFTITDEDVNKTNYLRTLCRQMANSVCKADADTFLITLDQHQLEIDTSDLTLGTLSKAFRNLFHNFLLEYMDPYVFLLSSMCETTLHVPLPFASRTRMKVGRAFSFNKTPSKLKRAMSTMMSPFGSTNSLTPAGQQLAQMRLASCNNINECDALRCFDWLKILRVAS